MFELLIYFLIKALHVTFLFIFKLKMTHVASTCALNMSKLACSQNFNRGL